MKKLLLNIFKREKNDRPVFTSEQIADAYKKGAVEIESLRKYDRGEKNIIAPDLILSKLFESVEYIALPSTSIF